MKKFTFLVLLYIIVLCSFNFAYAQNSSPITFYLNDDILTIDKISISKDSIMEISLYGSKTKLFEDSVSKFKQVEVDDGVYLVVITNYSDNLVMLYHGIMTIKDNEVLLSMDSYNIHSENLTRSQGIVPMSVVYETEPNNTLGTAMSINNDDDVYGRIYDSIDVDWYKVKFPFAGSANVWLGNIPSGKDYDLEFYNSSGTKIGSSTTTNTQELITINVSANVWYYIKVYGYNGSYHTSNYLLRTKVYTNYGAMNWGYFFSDTSINRISSPFGNRSGSFHNGFDISQSGIEGTSILSVSSGTVARRYLNPGSPKPNWSMGYAISIKSNNKDPETGYYLHHLYMHMKEEPIPSEVGNSVAKGEKIGLVGNTGESYGAHLHFQVTKNGAAWADGEANNINPVYFWPNIFTQPSTVIESHLSSEYERQDVLIPMELVDYVGLEKVKEWILVEKKANIIQFKFDINEFREYFHITDEKFTELIETNNLKDMYDVKKIINEKSIR